MASSLIISGDHGGVKTISDSTVLTPSSFADELFDLLVDLRADRAARRGQRERHAHVAVVDLHPVDQAELDEVEPQLGVDHVRQRVHHLVLGGYCNGLGHEASLAPRRGGAPPTFAAQAVDTLYISTGV